MSAFYVGQRVRKVRGYHVGIEGVVVGFGTECPPWDIVIMLGNYVVNEAGLCFVPGESADCFQDQWSPVVPPGLESDAEIAALYEPSPEDVSA